MSFINVRVCARMRAQIHLKVTCITVVEGDGKMIYRCKKYNLAAKKFLGWLIELMQHITPQLFKCRA